MKTLKFIRYEMANPSKEAALQMQEELKQIDGCNPEDDFVEKDGWTGNGGATGYYGINISAATAHVFHKGRAHLQALVCWDRRLEDYLNIVRKYVKEEVATPMF
jgi:hypothetical protein